MEHLYSIHHPKQFVSSGWLIFLDFEDVPCVHLIGPIFLP